MMFRAPALFPVLLVLFFLLFNVVIRVEADCFFERGITSPWELDAYTCLNSEKFRKDLDRLPFEAIRFVHIIFRESTVEKIEKDDLRRFGSKALGISIVHCGVEDIDEEAFNGLTELKGLILRRNRITTVKKGWFKDLSKLEGLDLSGNMIREFDPSIFDLIPLIQEFAISENHLTHFDIDAMKAKWPKIKKVGLQWNPYEWSQGVKIIEYSNRNPDLVRNSYTSIDGIRDTLQLVKDCQASIAKKDDPKELNDCVIAKLAKAIEYPRMLEGEKPVEPIKTA